MQEYRKMIAERRDKRQIDLYSQIKDVVGHTKKAAIVFDMSNKNENIRLEQNRQIPLKAIQLVSSVLAEFSLPAKPVIEYRGIVKNSSKQDGTIENGIIKIGASIRTLLGHKLHIDIPVIVNDCSMLEPAVFFYNDAPYVMSGPALDQLVRLGSMDKELQHRRMYSPPVENLPDDLPRTPIVNNQHQFSPGNRSPWTFIRRSSKESLNIELKNAIIRYAKLASKHTAGYNDLALSIIDQSKANPQLKQVVDHYTNWFIKENPHTTNDHPADILTRMLMANDEVRDTLEQYTGTMPAAPPSLSAEAPEQTPEEIDAGIAKTEEEMAARAMEVGRMQTASKRAQKGTHRGEPEDRLNIEEDVEIPELWTSNIPDHMLDPAERSREKMLSIGQNVDLNQEVEIRQRGGGHLILPKGETATILRAEDGSGCMYVVCFEDLDVTALLPAMVFDRQLKRAVTTDQIRHEVRAMQRDGYQSVDIKEALTRRYPEQAQTVLNELE